MQGVILWVSFYPLSGIYWYCRLMKWTLTCWHSWHSMQQGTYVLCKEWLAASLHKRLWRLVKASLQASFDPWRGWATWLQPLVAVWCHKGCFALVFEVHLTLVYLQACSGKFHPILQLMYFDSLECLPEEGDISEESCQPVSYFYSRPLTGPKSG